MHELLWNSWYLNVTFLLQQTCIEFCDLFWFAMSNASRWCKCYHSTQKNPLRSWYYIQVLDMMQRIPRLSYTCTALTKWSPQIWESAMICALQHISGVHISIISGGGRHCCCYIDTWHVVQFTCQIMCQVDLKPLEMLFTNSTSITRCQHLCWLRSFEEWWEQNANVLVWTTSLWTRPECFISHQISPTIPEMVGL